MSQTTASENAIQAFEKVAVQCSSIEATAVLKLENAKILEITACIEPHSPYKKFFVREPNAYIQQRFHSESLIEVMEEAGRKFNSATLLVPQIRVIATKSPVSKNELRYLAVAAFCLAFGLSIPTQKELKDTDKSAKNDTDQQKQSLIDLLSRGSEGVASWENARFVGT